MSENIISQKEIVYPEINIKALNQAVNNIWRLAQRQTSGIAIIEEKTKRISLYCRDFDEAVRSSLSQLEPTLRQLATQEYFQTITEIDAALADPDLNDDDRSALLEEREQLIQNLAKDIDHVISNFRDETNQLTGKINDIRNMVISERLGDLLAQAQSQKKELQSAIEQKAAEQNKLDADRAKIIESQDVIRQNNIADMFKDFIPSGNDIDKLDFTQPKKEAIKQAIKQGVEIARKILGKVSEGLKYAELADARVKLSEQIDQLTKEFDTLKTTLQETEQRLSGITDTIQIDEERTILLAEAVKLEQAWNSFANQLRNLSGSQINQKDLTSLINSQLDFLDNLASQYNMLK
ncbi:alpha-xenorhabdolysin family binary toxin subunit B [Xenorhabdus bovienii]|uniref:alpha-xenorhabdolysin family binary toxin subunit B n=1 Tax=Xenorhabdus bovienii TaxID=40576 RepID=UPI003DA5D96C